jgi:cytochrome c-type biogenesis protein CcmE
MADSGLTFLQIGYTGIWLGWFLFATYLFMKHARIKKDIENLKSVIKVKKSRQPDSKMKLIAIFIVFAVIAFVVNGILFQNSPPDEPETVSEVLTNLEDYDEDINFWTYGEVGTIFPGANNSARFKFNLIDSSNTNRTILINATLAPDGFEKDKKVVVTGSLENSSDNLTIKATRIDVGYPLKFHDNVNVWLGLFSLLIMLNLKQSDLEKVIAELEEKVNSHGRKR